MTDLLNDLDAPSDAELISRVRGGDVAAYGELFSRHVGAANRLGRVLTRGPDVDDLVSEAFAKVLQVLQKGGGPDVAFRAYLLTCVRRLHVDRIRATSKLQTSDDMTQFDPGIPFRDTAVDSFESGAAAKAFASLPERWQLVLWHLEVEGQKPAEIALLLGMSANSVSALAYRAREGLRRAFLTMHLSDTSDEECRWVSEHLGSYVRAGLSRRDNAKTKEHLDECRRCTAMYLELTEVNSNLAGIIAPLILGAAATGYLASGGATGALGLLALVGRIRDAVAANATAATAGAAAAGVVAAATVGILVMPSDDPDVATGADRTITATESTSPDTAPPDGLSDRSPDKSPGSGESQGARTSPPDPRDAAAPVRGLGFPTTSTAAPETTSASPSPTGSTPAPPSPTPPSPTPSETSPPPLLESDLVLSNAFIDDGQVVVSIQASPVMPPTVEIALTTSPTGIRFALGGECSLSPVNPSIVACTPAARSAPAPLARAVLSADEDAAAFTARIPLDIPTGQPRTSLTLSVSVPDGYADPVDENNRSASFTYTPPTPPGPEADFEMGELQQVARTDGDDGYHLTSRISGVPDDLDELFFDLSDNATFGEPTGVGDPDCTKVTDAPRVRCSELSGDFTVDFVVSHTQGGSGTVTITLAVPAGYTDPDPSNNSASTELVPHSDHPRLDVVLVSLEVVSDQSQVSRVRARVSGVPDSVTEVHFQLPARMHAYFTGGDDGATGEGDVDCRVRTSMLVTCTHPTDAFYADIDVFHPPGHSPETVTVTVVAVGVDENGDTGNNSREVTVG